VGINRVISQQAAQISFNHLFQGLGIGFFLLIAVVWLAKPPFTPKVRGGGAAH
jgi:DHA2 family multidrug resistance protein